MASIDVNFYDYNGVLYAFGVISGYSDVKAVRMYVSDGHDNTYYYHSTQIYSKSDALIMDDFGTDAFLFYTRTDRDVEDGGPTQLSYNVVDPDDSSGRGRYKVSFHFYSSTAKDATPLNATPFTPVAAGTSNVWYQMHNSLTTPSLTFDAETKTARLSNVGSGRYILEVKRTNRNKVNPDFSPAVKDYAYLVNMKSVEGTMGGRYREPFPVWAGASEIEEGYYTYCRYQSPRAKGWSWRACVLFDSGASYTDEEKSAYLAQAKKVFAQLEELTGTPIEVSSLTNSTYTKGDPDASVARIIEKYGYGWDEDNQGYDYDMLVRVGTATTIGVDSRHGGFWAVYAWDWGAEDGIETSFACINTSYDRETLEHVFAEEIFQSLHIGADNFEYPISRHWDPHYSNPHDINHKDSYNNDIQWDKEVMRFFYSRDLNGYSPIQLLNEMDTPCCLFRDYDGSEYYEFDLSELDNDEYEITGWVARKGENFGGGGTWSSAAQSRYNWDGGWDDAPYSMKAAITVTFGNRPASWSWEKSNGSATDIQTANAYTACANKGLAANFSYKVWNDLVDKVQAFLDYTKRSLWTIGTNNYGYSASMTYKALLTNAKMSDTDAKLYAVKFNIVRFCIGVMVTFNNATENNSIYQHHEKTGSWDMSAKEDILGEYIIDLAKKINQI